MITEDFVRENVEEGSTLYTDEAPVYDNIAEFKHEAVNHSAGEYLRDKAHTYSIESFWSMFNRGYIGTYHRMSQKHLKRYVAEFAGRNNMRQENTKDQMKSLPRNMSETHLPYEELIRDV